VITVTVLLVSVCATTANTIRKTAVAGTFYPADSAELAALVQSHLNAVPSSQSIDGELIALIVPHAGLVYSGAIAAHSYRCLIGTDVNTVILCGPSHRYRLDGASVHGPGIAWQTPLGQVVCRSDLCQELMRSERIGDIPAAHAREHCLEVQLPYLQTVLDDFTIVPIVLGNPSKENISTLTDNLSLLADRPNTVMIASTDWQHYHSATEGGKMDSLGMACLRDFDPERLERLLNEGRVEMCGGGAAIAVLAAARKQGANRVKILRYGDSGDISGDKSSVVGYVAAAVYRADVTEPPGQSTEDTVMSEKDYLSASDKEALLALARSSLKTYFKTGRLPDLSGYSGVLIDPGAAFVTLEKGGNLRGCIGYTTAVAPLVQIVAECAIKAAVQDPRFPPVEADELDHLHIEISVLTPLETVTSLEQITVGRDGLMISRGSRRGLLLPQVATEYGWDREEFLRHTCRKAGLPEDAYLDPDVTIQSFRAVVFEEH